jgi:hypothetical protein
MKLLMELFSKNSSTGEAELCQTGPSYILYVQQNEKACGLYMTEIKGFTRKRIQENGKDRA